MNTKWYKNTFIYGITLSCLFVSAHLGTAGQNGKRIQVIQGSVRQQGNPQLNQNRLGRSTQGAMNRNGCQFVDANGDGICDLQGSRQGQGSNFVDANGDGICDNAGSQAQQRQGQGKGNMSRQMRTGNGGCGLSGTCAQAGQGGANRGQGFGRGTQNQNCATCLPAASGVLSEVESATLLFMREEEKLARDVYLKMYELWATPVFAMIANAEQRHMDAVLSRIEAYQLADPIQEDGTFTNPELQSLFTSLIEKGSSSQNDALRVGALIEEMDIADLAEALVETDQTDLIVVYTHLKRASENHLRAFIRQLALLGETYTPQHLSQKTVDEILQSPNSSGMGNPGKHGKRWND